MNIASSGIPFKPLWNVAVWTLLWIGYQIHHCRAANPMPLNVLPWSMPIKLVAVLHWINLFALMVISSDRLHSALPLFNSSVSSLPAAWPTTSEIVQEDTPKLRNNLNQTTTTIFCLTKRISIFKHREKYAEKINKKQKCIKYKFTGLFIDFPTHQRNTKFISLHV